MLFTNQTILIAMGFARGGHTFCVAGEAVADKKSIIIGDQYYIENTAR